MASYDPLQNARSLSLNDNHNVFFSFISFSISKRTDNGQEQYYCRRS